MKNGKINDYKNTNKVDYKKEILKRRRKNEIIIVLCCLFLVLYLDQLKTE